MKKRAIALVLTLLMMLTLVPAAAMADENTVKIGTKEYATLADAVMEAVSGNTIELLADISTGTVTIPGSVTLDLKGHTITLSENARISASNNVTIKNGSVLGNRSSESRYGCIDATGVNVRIESIYAYSQGIGGGYGGAAFSTSERASATIEKCHFKADLPVSKMTTYYYHDAVYVDRNSSVTINSGTFDGAIFVMSDNAYCTINNGVFNSFIVTDRKSGCAITINGGTFNRPNGAYLHNQNTWNAVQIANFVFHDVGAVSAGAIVMTGGCLNYDPNTGATWIDYNGTGTIPSNTTCRNNVIANGSVCAAQPYDGYYGVATSQAVLDAREAALKAIDEALKGNDSESARKAAEEAKELIRGAGTLTEIEDVKEDAVKEIKYGEQLRKAKEDAIAKLRAKAGDNPSEAVARILEEQIAAINAVTDLEDIEAVLANGLRLIEEQQKKEQGGGSSSDDDDDLAGDLGSVFSRIFHRLFVTDYDEETLKVDIIIELISRCIVVLRNLFG